VAMARPIPDEAPVTITERGIRESIRPVTLARWVWPLSRTAC